MQTFDPVNPTASCVFFATVLAKGLRFALRKEGSIRIKMKNSFRGVMLALLGVLISYSEAQLGGDFLRPFS